MVQSAAMLSELAERDTTGDLTLIYAEIRTLCAVPDVSSMRRHLATRPRWLEWSGAAIRPVFLDGSAQTAAWHAVGRMDTHPLPALSRAELRCLGVDDVAGAGHPRHLRELRAGEPDERYRETSPQMIVFGSLLRDALPA